MILINISKSNNTKGLKHYERAGGYISYDPSVLTEHYQIKGFEGDDKEDPNKAQSKWC